MPQNSPIVVLALAVALLAAPVAAAAPSAGGPLAAQATETATATPTTAGNSSVAPGEKLAGVVAVQQAELEGEVAERTYGVKIAQANSSKAKAEVVAETLDDVEQRIENLEQRKQTLKEARQNGSMSEGEYRAKMAAVAAELSTARRLANATAETAEGLPADVLEAKGINVSAIQALKNRAENLSGPQVAKIAQSIAGKDVGKSMAGKQKPSDVGKQLPGAAENRTGGPPGDQGAPNGTDGGAPNGTDGGAPNGTDGGAPNGTDGGAPNGTDGKNGSGDRP